MVVVVLVGSGLSRVVVVVVVTTGRGRVMVVVVVMVVVFSCRVHNLDFGQLSLICGDLRPTYQQ